MAPSPRLSSANPSRLALLARICLCLAALLLLAGGFAPARAQVIDTVAGGFIPPRPQLSPF